MERVMMAPVSFENSRQLFGSDLRRTLPACALLGALLLLAADIAARAVAVERRQNTVTTADGEVLPYDKLGLAAPMRERGSVQVEEYREDGLYLEGIVKTEDLHCFDGYLV